MADPPWLAYLLSLGHVGVALGTDGAGRLGRLEGCAVHLQPPQVTAPEAALIHNACLGCPPAAGAIPRGLVCTDQMQSGLALEWNTPLSQFYPALEDSSLPHLVSSHIWKSTSFWSFSNNSCPHRSFWIPICLLESSVSHLSTLTHSQHTLFVLILLKFSATFRQGPCLCPILAFPYISAESRGFWEY